jgi:hypothetical protein
MRSFLLFLAISGLCHAAPKQIRVFVALCDNKTQGIVPVGEKIGNGDDPDANLYWGCTDGLAVHFRKSGNWKQVKSEKDVSNAILRRLSFKHAAADIELVADAYRGSEMGVCIVDFEKAAASGKYDLVAFIGHNGLMDGPVQPPAAVAGNDAEVVVLCCLSERYFRKRLEALGCRPLLMTSQLMYPGSFLLSAAIESWRQGGDVGDVRAAAGSAYAQNQKIATKAATGVFADLKRQSPADSGD